MNFVADIGNSGIKAAVYSKGIKSCSGRFGFDEEKALAEFIRQNSFERSIISSVREIPGYLNELINEKNATLHILSANSKLPFVIDYETPETLGSDRIAAVSGACKAFPGKDCLVIDAGSAITYDFLIKGRFRGGNISPGIDMRFKALHTFTGKLPLVSKKPFFSFPAVNTHDAVAGGVISGIIFEINEYICTFKQRYNGSVIILTGGDGDFLRERVMEKPFYMPDLVMDGLNFILEYNA